MKPENEVVRIHITNELFEKLKKQFGYAGAGEAKKFVGDKIKSDLYKSAGVSQPRPLSPSEKSALADLRKLEEFKKTVGLDDKAFGQQKDFIAFNHGVSFDDLDGMDSDDNDDTDDSVVGDKDSSVAEKTEDAKPVASKSSSPRSSRGQAPKK